MLVAPAARADDALTTRARLDAEAHAHVLELDPELQPRLEGLGAVEQSTRTTLPLDVHTVAMLTLAEWANEDTADHPLIDVPAAGWRAGFRLARDLGFATVELHGELDHVESRYGRGTYRDVGISIGRTFRLSRWMTAWISLGLAHRHWLDQAPAGEPSDETTVMLTIGTTFR